MKKEAIKKLFLEGHAGCMGNFNLKDPVCRRYCALNLRCAIEQEQNVQMDILEDLISASSFVMKVQ